MNKLVVVLFYLMSTAGALGASGISQEMLPLSSTVYDDMDALYLAAGAGTPSNSRPWSKTEALMILARIDRSALEGAMLSLFEAIEEEIEPGLRFRFGDGFQFGARLDATAEAYAHTDTEAFTLDTDWLYGFEDRKPLARLALDFRLMDFLYIYCDLQYGRNRTNYLDEISALPDGGVGAIIGQRTSADDVADSYERGAYVAHSAIYSQAFLTNILGHSYDFDFEWPKRAVAAVGGANWNIALARDKISWGNGHSGNFIIDGHVDYHEYARLEAFSDYFKYDWLNAFFPTEPGRGERPDDGFRVLMAHRLEFRILDRLTVALSEDVMYQNDVFDMRYVNPAFIYHNLNNRSMFNAIAHAEADFSPGPGWNVYGQFALDQARAPDESAAQADAIGYLAGLESGAALGPGIIRGSLEYAYTSPLLYRRDGVDFLMFRRYFTHGSPEGYGYVDHFDYIGYEYGGDAQVLRGDLEYRLPGLGAIGLVVMGMRHGEMGFFTSHNTLGDNSMMADYQGTTPSGDAVAESLSVSLSGKFKLPSVIRWVKAELWAQADWIGKRTYVKADGSYAGGACDIQISAGMSISL